MDQPNQITVTQAGTHTVMTTDISPSAIYPSQNATTSDAQSNSQENSTERRPTTLTSLRTAIERTDHPDRPSSIASVVSLLNDMGLDEASNIDAPQFTRLLDLLRATKLKPGSSEAFSTFFTNYRSARNSLSGTSQEVRRDSINSEGQARRHTFDELKTLRTLSFSDALSKSSAAASALGLCPSEGMSDGLMMVLLRTTTLTYVYCAGASFMGALTSYATSSLSNTTLVSGVAREVNDILQYDITSWTSFYLLCIVFWVHSLSGLISGEHALGESLGRASKASLVIGTVQLVLQTVVPLFSRLFTVGAGLLQYLSRNTLASTFQDALNSPGSTHTLFIYHAPLLALPIFMLLSAIHSAYVRESRRKQSLLQDERISAQETLNQAITEYAERRSVFLTTVAQEFNDATNMASATLEQFSPSILLSKNQELLAACSIPVPTASISALNTTMKHIHHLSSTLPSLSRLLFVADPGLEKNLAPDLRVLSSRSEIRVEFDIGELMQNVGDALAGTAAKLGVELVVYHSDNALHYMNVMADEGGFRHALMNLLRTILDSCNPGASVELGLNIAPFTLSPTSDSSFISSINKGDRLQVTFEVIHNPSPTAGDTVLCPNANLTDKLVTYLGGSLRADELDGNRTRFEVTVEVEAGTTVERRSVPEQSNGHPRLQRRLSGVRFSSEPTLDDLVQFIELLRGVKVVLHATDQSVFARHLTSCLTSWGTDISHVPVTLQSDTTTATSGSGYFGSDYNFYNTVMSFSNSGDSITNTPPSEGGTPTNLVVTSPRGSGTTSPVGEFAQKPSRQNHSTSSEEQQLQQMPPAFVLIDDDIQTLEEKLLEFRNQPPSMVAPPTPAHGTNGNGNSHYRRHRRGKSNGGASGMSPQTTAIIHFTSLSNYKQCKDAVQWLVSGSPLFPPAMSVSPFFPQVLVVPKPAGPRRVLTTLHTAMTKAIVEPHYNPIATSPSTPLTPASQNGLTAGSMSTGSTTPTTPGETGTTMRRSRSSLNPPTNYFPDSAVNSVDGIGSPTGIKTSEAGVFDPSTKANGSTSPRPGGGVVASAPRPQRTQSGSLLQQQHEIKLQRRRSNTDLKSPAEVSSGALLPIPSGFSMPPPNQVSPGGRSPLRTSITKEELMTSSPDSMSSTSSTPPTSTPTGSTLGSSAHHKGASGEENEPAKATAAFEVAVDGTGSPTGPLSPPGAKKVMANGLGPRPATPVQPSSKSAVGAATSAGLTKKRGPNKKGTSNQSGVSPPINVLIVEDNPINQSILSAWMRKRSIKYSVASNGQEAVDKWRQGGFHLVLMDLQLPVMSGIDATKEIRRLERIQKIGVFPSTPNSIQAALDANPLSQPSSPTTSTTPANSAQTPPVPQSPFRSPVIIVALTASSLESDRHAALAAGCNDFLTKPVSLEWLARKIIEWGCMQALIDFEGWRKWKRSEDSTSTSTSTSTTSTTTITMKPTTATVGKRDATTAAAVTAMGSAGVGVGLNLSELASAANGGAISPGSNSSSSTPSTPGTPGKKGILLQGAMNVKRRASRMERSNTNPDGNAGDGDGDEDVESGMDAKNIPPPATGRAERRLSSSAGRLPPIREGSSSSETTTGTHGGGGGKV
ncbi:hypothetical protein BC937DRAFT_92138 [Endogone sp. FLAS-F59071]|nr:hypothetical protein BC937DRAFT_92138 [Endogone sp. FLAS-F59071]|eukprot:RUS15678.1 hypothetical protein BC937DRAFT_92138 [Endogone sp. FLAS-F59071]